VLDTAKEDSAFEIIPTRNMYGSQKDLLKVDNDVDYPTLSTEEMRILDFVMEGSAPLNWNEFIKLVYSTYPIVSQERYSKLDLVRLAQEYEEVVPLLDSSG
jgi:hypothetical protein